MTRDAVLDQIVAGQALGRKKVIFRLT